MLCIRSHAVTLFVLLIEVVELSAHTLGFHYFGGRSSTNSRWRWVFWGLTLLHMAVVILLIVGLPETHPGIILDKRAKRMCLEGEDVVSPMKSGQSPSQVFVKYLSRPFKVLVLNFLS